MYVPTAALILLALAIVFGVLAARDYRRGARQMNPARKAWLRVALIFSTIGIALLLWHNL